MHISLTLIGLAVISLCVSACSPIRTIKDNNVLNHVFYRRALSKKK